jgi:flagellar basal body-associated protein FliL
MKRKLKLIVPILVLVLGVAVYKFVLSTPTESKAKVKGEVYVMPKEFIVNLSGGSFAKLTVALVLAPGQSSGAAAATPPPEGFGTLEEEPLVREIVTDNLTGASPQALTSGDGRHGYEQRINKAINHETDVATRSVAFTDLVVQ